MNFKLPIIETERLILREIKESDVNDMYEYAHLPYIGPSAGWAPHQSKEETRTIIRMMNGKYRFGGVGTFAIVYKENSKMIGTIELHSMVKNYKAELGYTVNPEYWGKGIAFEGAKAIIPWGFEALDLKRIECTAFTNNYQSKRVCEKLGLTYEGIRKKGYVLYNGYIGDIYCYAITDDEFRERIKNGTW